jgi:hypothetical protein
MATKEKSIARYLISEIIIVASIIFCVFNLIGMKFETRDYEKQESTKPFCDCSDDQDALKSIAYEKYHLSEYRYETVYKHYYLQKDVMQKYMRPGYIRIFDLMLVLCLYFLLMGLISLIATENSPKYYYSFFIFSEFFAWLFTFPWKYAERRKAERETLNEESFTKIKSTVSRLNKFLD